MPIIKSAKKALKQSRKKRLFNLHQNEKMKSSVKQIKKLIADKKTEDAIKALPRTYKAIDKAAKHNVISDNTASRKKSRLAIAIHKMGIDNKKSS